MLKRVTMVAAAGLTRWVGLVSRHPLVTMVLAVVLAAAAVWLAATGLAFNTDTADMISPELPFRRAQKAYARTFPQFEDNLIVVVEGATAGLAEDGAAALAARLAAEPATFTSVYLPGGGPFFVRNGLLYLDRPELERLAANLADVQPLVAAIAADPTLAGVFGQLGSAIDEMRTGSTAAFDLGDAFARLGRVIAATLKGESAYLSWYAVLRGETETADDRRRLVVLKPALNFAALNPAGDAMAAVRTAARELGLTPDHGVRVRLTGSAALDADQLASAWRGARIAGPLSFLLVGLILWRTFRSPALMLATLVALVIGLAWTAGFATLAVGRLNVISMAFAVLFIGLGVDFAVHLGLRYRELCGLGVARPLLTAGATVGTALALCAATTAAGFFIFVPTDYVGVAELGLIAGSGMGIALIATLTVMPAMLTLIPAKVRPAPMMGRRMTALATAPLRHRQGVRIGAAVLAVAALALIPEARFDFNPLNLQDPKAESVATLRQLMADPDLSPWQLVALVHGLDAAKVEAARLAKLASVKRTVTLADLVPDDQEAKLGLIEQMAWFMGPPPNAVATADPTRERAALTDLRARLADWLASGSVAPELAPRAKAFAVVLDGLAARVNGGGGDALLATLRERLTATLRGRLDRLYTALGAAAPVTLETLPRSLSARYLAADGTARIAIVARDDLLDPAALRRFVAEVRSVDPRVVGDPVSLLEAGNAVVRAFRQAMISAVVVITLILLVVMRRLTDVLYVVAPLALAGLLTGAATVVLGVPFNFANVIVLPLLLGIGVDSAIHIVHRRRTEGAALAYLLRSSTTRAIVFSGLTTIASFASLTLSGHRGTASMGLLLTVGVTMTVLATLGVLPALLPPDDARQDEEERAKTKRRGTGGARAASRTSK